MHRRQLGEQFLEHVVDVHKDDKNASKPGSRDILISPIILSSIWQSAAFPYIKEAWKDAKLKKKIQIGTLDSHGINERFSFN